MKRGTTDKAAITTVFLSVISSERRVRNKHQQGDTAFEKDTIFALVRWDIIRRQEVQRQMRIGFQVGTSSEPLYDSLYLKKHWYQDKHYSEFYIRSVCSLHEWIL